MPLKSRGLMRKHSFIRDDDRVYKIIRFKGKHWSNKKKKQQNKTKQNKTTPPPKKKPVAHAEAYQNIFHMIEKPANKPSVLF